MKRYFTIILILFYSVAFAQENYKGKVSLVFNEEKIVLPINVVTLKKENKVLISIRAERNNEKVQQLFSLEWEFKKLSTNDKDLSMYDAFFLNVINNTKDQKDELLFRMANNAEDGKLIIKKDSEIKESFSFSMKFNIEDVSFENSSIVMKGMMEVKARDSKSAKPKEAISQIENCKFEIVI